MLEELKTAAKTADKPTARPVLKKPAGVIVYNPNLDSWRCIDASGKEVLSIGSKQAAIAAYPTFVVKE